MKVKSPRSTSRKLSWISVMLVPPLLALAGACGGETSTGVATGGSAGDGNVTGGGAGNGNATGSAAGSGSGGVGGSGGNNICGDPFMVHGGTPCPKADLRCANACGSTCNCAGPDLSWSCPDVATCGACPLTAPPPGTKCRGFT